MRVVQLTPSGSPCSICRHFAVERGESVMQGLVALR
jgi:hypothetical protein